MTDDAHVPAIRRTVVNPLRAVRPSAVGSQYFRPSLPGPWPGASCAKQSQLSDGRWNCTLFALKVLWSSRTALEVAKTKPIPAGSRGRNLDGAGADSGRILPSVRAAGGSIMRNEANWLRFDRRRLDRGGGTLTGSTQRLRLWTSSAGCRRPVMPSGMAWLATLRLASGLYETY